MRTSTGIEKKHASLFGLQVADPAEDERNREFTRESKI
jgi:hypothetical protein